MSVATMAPCLPVPEWSTRVALSMEVVFVGTGDARRYGVLRYPVAQVLLDWRIGIAVPPLRRDLGEL